MKANHIMIDPRLVEFSRKHNTELNCFFREETTRVAWAINYQLEVPKEDTVIAVAAEILNTEYIPLPTQLQYYCTYAQGDDCIYPQV